ncbi:capsid/nuclear shuttle family protein [Pseudomonas sp. L01]|nr:capsid/nuclear shuttle family protein [Pseudomonas sp. L01]
MGGNRLPANLRSFGGEVKALDSALQSTSGLNATGSVTCLNLIRAGSSFFNRIGRRVELKNITFSAAVAPLRTSTTSTSEYIRIIVVYDRQTNGANPAIADVLQSVDQAGANTTTSFSGINLNNRDRFRIFIDERITLPNITVAGAITTSPSVDIDPLKTTFNIKRFVKLGRELTQYKADSAPAVVGDIATGGLFLVMLGSAGAGTEAYGLNWESRVRFNDV